MLIIAFFREEVNKKILYFYLTNITRTHRLCSMNAEEKEGNMTAITIEKSSSAGSVEERTKNKNWWEYIRENPPREVKETLLGELAQAEKDYEKRLDSLYWLIIFRLVNITQVSCYIKKSNNLTEARYYFSKAQEMIKSYPQKEYKRALFEKMGPAFEKLKYWSDIEDLLEVAAPGGY
ncbi:MAG: hypothetical protein PHI66_02720 [Candidatus Pacebacteria bacterium]|nr:hypothetical protein [Candidatus Paceibacterota bacterium]